MKIKRLVLGSVGANCYLLFQEDTKEALLLDPGGNPQRIGEVLREEGLHPLAILLTHGHCDHCAGAKEIALTWKVPIFAAQEEEALLANPQWNLSALLGEEPFSLQEVQWFTKEKEQMGSFSFEILKTPGHTKGGVCFYFPQEKTIFTGDTLFAGSVGRTDFPTGESETLLHSIREKIMVLPGDTLVCPGHGEATSVAQEAAHNPYLQEDGTWFD